MELTNKENEEKNRSLASRRKEAEALEELLKEKEETIQKSNQLLSEGELSMAKL